RPASGAVIRVTAADPLVIALRAGYQHALRFDLADHPADVATQLEAGDQATVGVAQEPHIVDADQLGGLGLFGPANTGDLVTREFEVEATRVAVSADAIHDFDA